jgi:hypothetical protein
MPGWSPQDKGEDVARMRDLTILCMVVGNLKPKVTDKDTVDIPRHNDPSS